MKFSKLLKRKEKRKKQTVNAWKVLFIFRSHYILRYRSPLQVFCFLNKRKHLAFDVTLPPPKWFSWAEVPIGSTQNTQKGFFKSQKSCEQTKRVTTLLRLQTWLLHSMAEGSLKKSNRSQKVKTLSSACLHMPDFRGFFFFVFLEETLNLNEHFLFCVFFCFFVPCYNSQKC